MQSDLGELEALLKYMVNHNTEHAQALKQLSERAKRLGKASACVHLSNGIRQMHGANKNF